ncbi:hypothetical protein CEXT_489431 [Caerostris extrusa]|uniref:Uncharacterized protein n=1 Tax=Caerostris extrusa TaxID=172846 RepID=A0AAV4QI35_CAEEX|nr:hypothetical protein CEXT_489431 [Caerostris extrusa]
MFSLGDTYIWRNNLFGTRFAVENLRKMNCFRVPVTLVCEISNWMPRTGILGNSGIQIFAAFRDYKKWKHETGFAKFDFIE